MKQYFNNKRRNIIAYSAVVAAFVFAVLPAIFFDESESAPPHIGYGGSEGSLPVIMSENPLSKYFKKAASFYGLGGNERNAFGRGRGKLPAPPAENYTDEERTAIFAAHAKEKVAARSNAASAPSASANTQKQFDTETISLQPDKKGYHYEGKYYKNGAYPDASLKKQIENSIAEFHKSKADEEGKTAAYVLQDDGSMIVKYLSRRDLAGYGVNGGSYDYGGGSSSGFSDRYDGAVFLSKNNSGGRSGGGLSSSGGVADYNGDFSAGYSAVRGKLEDIKKNNISREALQIAQSAQEISENRRRQEIMQIIREMRNLSEAVNIFDEKRFTPVPPVKENKKDTEAITDKDNTYISKALQTQLEALGIRCRTCKKIEYPNNIYAEAGKLLENKLNIFDANNGYWEYFEKISESEGAKVFKPGDNKDNKIWLNVLSIPSYTPGGDKNIVDIFFKDNGFENMLKQMGVGNDQIEKLKTQYEKLDEYISKANEKIDRFYEDNPSLKRPEVIYILGKDENADPRNRKFWVATDKFWGYALTQNAVPEGETFEGEADEYYKEIGGRELSEKLQNPNVITVIVESDNNDNNQKKDKNQKIEIFDKPAVNMSTPPTPSDMERVRAELDKVSFSLAAKDMQKTTSQQPTQKNTSGGKKTPPSATPSVNNKAKQRPAAPQNASRSNNARPPATSPSANKGGSNTTKTQVSKQPSSTPSRQNTASNKDEGLISKFLKWVGW
ncbi:MAG: hypothetical protein LBG46_01200 [Elusimicrobiota bacterium]|jgi:hypothetical protein|nr:hypothetical protein [Elusimicrobiota bacterium]